MSEHCQFVSKQGEHCSEPDFGNGYCFWHDSTADKSGLQLADKLENFAKNGGLTKGLKLKRTNLQGINLVRANHQDGYDFSESDFYRCNLSDAHLFNICLCDGSLMKANLCDANLHCAKLNHTNLLGTKLVDARLDNLDIGDELRQDTLAREHLAKKETEQARDNFEQAEEIYRNLRKYADRQGLYGMAGMFSYKEQVMRRFLMPRWSARWMFSHIVDLMCGYGEKPENTVIFSLSLILICALGYFFFGVNYHDQLLQFQVSAGFIENVKTFFLAVYYSVVTFTTLGYGDITPVGITRFFAVIEAFMGSFTLALFVVVFVKRINR